MASVSLRPTPQLLQRPDPSPERFYAPPDRVLIADPSRRQDVRFDSDGLSLAGHLYRPPGAGSADRTAAIAMCGPSSSVKEQTLPHYAERFSDAGYTVLDVRLADVRRERGRAALLLRPGADRRRLPKRGQPPGRPRRRRRRPGGARRRLHGRRLRGLDGGARQAPRRRREHRRRLRHRRHLPGQSRHRRVRAGTCAKSTTSSPASTRPAGPVHPRDSARPLGRTGVHAQPGGVQLLLPHVAQRRPEAGRTASPPSRCRRTSATTPSPTRRSSHRRRC